jgi:uncharacterized protein
MTDRAEVTVRHAPDQQRFEAIVNDQVAGWIAYEERDGTLDLQHTVVEDKWEGKGVGSQLVSGALDQVRADGGSIVATCPFVSSYVERHDEYADLVA